MKPANFAAVYCSIYPQLCETVRLHGYALSIHGTLARDMDLVCIPWVSKVSSPEIVIKDITTKFALRQIGDVTIKEHGREAYTIMMIDGFGFFIDLSFMPRISSV